LKLISDKEIAIEKVMAVVFSCRTSYHVRVAEKMYENWTRMYKDDDTDIFNFILLKRREFDNDVEY